AAFAVAIASLADATRSPSLAVVPLRNLLTASSTTHYNPLTKAHHLFLRYAIQAKLYKLALPVVVLPLTEVVKGHQASIGRLQVVDFLLYTYYSGIVFAALKRFDEAVDCFRMTLAAPSKSGASAIQMEAWRKGVLCFALSGSSTGSGGSIVKGFEKGGIGKCVNGVVFKVLDGCGAKKGYIEFLSAVEGAKRGSVLIELQKHAELFMKSGNLGLAKQCASATHLTQQHILKLTQTYLTLSVSDVTKAVQETVFRPALPPTTVSTKQQQLTQIPSETITPPQIKSHILQLINAKKVHATINDSIADDTNGMVSFHDESETYADLNALIQLDALLKTAMRVYTRVNEMDKSVGISKEYLSRVGQVGGTEDKRYMPNRMGSFGFGGGSGSFGGAGMFDGGDEGFGDDDVMMDEDGQF
ncbi:UNVERIFIED_CONTAM: COP9 signalosome complex subunit 3, partial [Siphonaria sp. JEL0065]